MAGKRKPDNEVSAHTLWYREYRAKKKAGTYIADIRYTPYYGKDEVARYAIEVIPDETSKYG